MAKELLLVGLGGLVGSVLRFLVFKVSSYFSPAGFLLSTLIVNLTGSFLIGVLYALVERSAGVAAALRPLLMVGFCGGFTTFSAFSLENYQLLKEGQYTAVAAYSVASVVLGLAAVILGVRTFGLFAD